MKKLWMVALLLLCSGCVTDQGTFTVISNKVVDVQDFELNKADRIRNVEGDDTSHIIFLFPTKNNPNVSGALRNAFDKADGDVMTDTVIKSWYWYIPYIYGQTGWTVEGDVVKTRKK